MKIHKIHDNCVPRFLIGLLLIFPGLTQMSCKKLVEVPAPTTTITGTTAYADDATAASVMTGIYATAIGGGMSSGLSSTSLYAGLSADEFTLYSGANGSIDSYYYMNALTNQNTSYSDFWSAIYPLVFDANSAIQGLTASATLTPAVKKQLLGEATFMRAFCYFYLVNEYGDVPLITGTDYQVNGNLPRTPKAQVWQQIITDLKTAQTLLSANFLDASVQTVTTQRLRPTKWAALALLSRSYLYYAGIDNANASNDYTKADSAATAVITNTAQFGLEPLDNVFLSANNNEAIWQLQPTQGGQNTPDAWAFIIPSTGLNAYQNTVSLSNNLVNSFEPGDQRKTNWIDTITVSGNLYYFPYKYKSATYGAPVTEYEDVLRLGELYLIRAEAKAVNNDPADAIKDLNMIRNRAGLPGYTGPNDLVSLKNAILHERQVELFTEWGHRWFDLKRTGAVDPVMSVAAPQKGGSWSSFKQLYPIPLSELQHDLSIKQNPGY